MFFRRALTGVAMGAVMLIWAGTAVAASPNVVISQVYGGGGNSTAPFTHDFVELFNRGTTTVSIAGWSLQYTSASGTGNFGSATNLITPLSGAIDPGQYVLVQEAPGAGTGVPLPAADVTDGTPISMSATDGKVAVVNSTTPLGCNGGSSPCSIAALASIVDLVGYGSANFFEGGSAAPALSNTLGGLRRANGCTDTDNNGADFTRQTPTPRNRLAPKAPCPNGDSAPSVASTVPAGGATGVAVDAGLTVTFSEPVTVTDPWYSIACTASGAHSATVTGGPTVFQLNPATDFGAGESCTFSVLAAGVSDLDALDPPDRPLADFTWTVATELPPVRIHEIQGALHASTLAGQSVSRVPGIVTQKTSNGFFLQDPAPDADPATSEGIFVFGSISAGLVAVGDAIQVNGTVSEFLGSPSATNLPLTEITNTSVQVVSHGNPLPAATLWSPPAETIEDDAAGDLRTSGVFDPSSDGIDYAESLEGMRVEIDDATASGPSVDFTSSQTTEVSLVGPGAGLRTPRGGIVIRASDFNPERLILQAPLGTFPAGVDVGDTLPGATVGALDYSFGNYKLRPAGPLAFVPGGLQRETTAAATADRLSVATFNVENLDPSDGPAKFDGLAHVLVDNLRSPDLVALEEVQDNDGATDSGTVGSDLTLDTLVAAIEAAGGPTYAYRYVAPVDGRDGGEPGGNIRVAFLYRTDRGLAFVDRPGAGSLTPNAVVGTGAATQLQYSPGRIDPVSTAWSSSRKPLAAEFTYNGHRLFAIANHFNSKSGDQPLYGRFQPPVRTSETQRHRQATEVRDFANELLAADPSANLVVLGDLNDFQFSDTLSILKEAGLRDLLETLPPAEQYTYDFDGNSQAIDHILVAGNLFDHPGLDYDVVHVNSEFHEQTSDHDPQVVLLTLARPTISATRSPAPNAAGWNNTDVTVTFTCVDPLSALVACPAPVTVTAEGAGQSVAGSSALKGGGTVSATVSGISIDRTAPTVAYTGNAGVYGVDEVVQIACSATDALSHLGSTTCADIAGPAYSFGLGSHTFTATATDRAGNTGTATTTFTVTVSATSLCGLVEQFVANHGIANSLCVKLAHGSYAAFVHEVRAQSGKALTTAQADLLVALVQTL